MALDMEREQRLRGKTPTPPQKSSQRLSSLTERHDKLQSQRVAWCSQQVEMPVNDPDAMTDDPRIASWDHKPHSFDDLASKSAFDRTTGEAQRVL